MTATAGVSAWHLLVIFVGGGVGAMLRYLVSIWAARLHMGAFPLGIFLSNVIGSFLIGLAFVYLVEDKGLDPVWRLGLIVGLLGGLTTFSTFSLDSVLLIQQRAFAAAFMNISGTLLTCLLATALGIFFAKG